MLNMTSIQHLVEEYARYASEEINQELNLQPGYNQTHGNRCDKLTLGVMQALQVGGFGVRRELHADAGGNWHYLLAHADIDTAPTDTDLISDLNPWQWRGYGTGILHAPRDEVMNRLQAEGAPTFFVALRSVRSIAQAHDTRRNPFS